MNKKEIKYLVKFIIIAVAFCYIGTELMHDYYMEQYQETLRLNELNINLKN